MKLPKPESCPPLSGRGNPERWTTIVEGRGIGFWTRVRLPSTPSTRRYTNTIPSIEFSVFRNVFGITVYTDDFDTEQYLQKKKASYKDIRAWIKMKFGVCVSNLNVSQAKRRFGLCQSEYKGKEASGKYPQPVLSDEKLELIRLAFEHFGLI